MIQSVRRAERRRKIVYSILSTKGMRPLYLCVIRSAWQKAKRQGWLSCQQFPSCIAGTSRQLSTKGENGDEDSGVIGAKDAERKVTSPEKIKSSSDEPSTLNLSKPGGMGKAGELRKALEESGGDQKAARRSRKKEAANKGEQSSSDSDDELISSSSSSSESSSSSSSEEERGGGGSDKAKRPAIDKPSELLSPKIRQAVKDVSKSLGGDEKRTRSDLLKKLLEHEKESYKASKIQLFDDDEQEKSSGKQEAGGGSTADLSSLLGGMKVEKSAPVSNKGGQSRERFRAGMAKASDQLLQRYRKTAGPDVGVTGGGRPEQLRRPPTKQQRYEKTDFFESGPGLGIFAPVKDKLKPSYPPLMPVWENLERLRLKSLTAREPRNGFEEFIRWTEEGKMHPYPIDNDYGHYELNVPFHEHVFLEQLLEEGFPATGPIRHFMEIVVHGLSSNPYMTVEKKHEHIAWFRDYFKKRGPEIEKLHDLDLKHQQALSALDAAAPTEDGKTTASP